jgi:hypothetical protein
MVLGLVSKQLSAVRKSKAVFLVALVKSAAESFSWQLIAYS